MSLRDIDLSEYEDYLKLVSSLSGLFSDSERPLINYRTAEKLFCLVSGAKDVGRADCSFDASIVRNSSGVGVKTFTAPNSKHKSMQKVAEFSRDQHINETSGLWGKDLALKVSGFRNTRVLSDARERSLNLATSYYHCLVRLPAGVLVHEENYELINVDSLKPLTSRGKVSKVWPSARTKTIHFTDGRNRYSFHAGKNTLFKEFDLEKGYTSKIIPVEIIKDVFAKLLSVLMSESARTPISKSVDLQSLFSSSSSHDDEFVVLPLFASRSNPSNRQVAPKSGINQWNASGRPRKFGESYIPVPAEVRKLRPDFFPPNDKKFKLILPTGDVVSAKICQQGGKALMADPNTDLLEWLFSVIDGDMKTAESRLEGKRPYTYDDLLSIGKDCVMLRMVDKSDRTYSVEFAEIGAYEDFLLSENYSSEA